MVRRPTAYVTPMGGTTITGIGYILPDTSFKSDSTYASYPYRADVLMPEVTTDTIVLLTFYPDDEASGNFAHFASAHEGGFYIYSKVKRSVNIPQIVLLQGYSQG